MPSAIEELAGRLARLESQGKLLEAQRLRMPTNYDIEMMRQVGFCPGIRELPPIDGGGPARARDPATISPRIFLLVIDESHVTVPQIGGMYERAASPASATWWEYGFGCRRRRQPSATCFADRIGRTVYLSARTPTSSSQRPAASSSAGDPARPVRWTKKW